MCTNHWAVALVHQGLQEHCAGVMHGKLAEVEAL